jgi:hypothetical protein
MSDMTYFGAVPFERDEEGEILAGTPREARSEIAARCLAAAMAATKPGAVAFSRTSDSSSSQTGAAVIIARYGDVPDEVRALEDA